MTSNSSGGGYIDCACRDCFEIAISDKGEPTLCDDCQIAGCEVWPGEEAEAAEKYSYPRPTWNQYECQREDAYGVGDEDEDEAEQEEE